MLAIRLLMALSLTVVVTACGRKDVIDHKTWLSLRPGMTLDQITRRIGHAGRVVRDDENLDGRLIRKEGEVIYLWQNRDGSDATFAFKEKVMTGAAESGL